MTVTLPVPVSVPTTDKSLATVATFEPNARVPPLTVRLLLIVNVPPVAVKVGVPELGAIVRL